MRHCKIYTDGKSIPSSIRMGKKGVLFFKHAVSPLDTISNVLNNKAHVTKVLKLKAPELKGIILLEEDY